MNFCEKSNEYISLYIDELLDDKSSVKFLKHIEECDLCSNKLKEMSYFAQLCREDQDIQLPEDFESSLHRRLLEESPTKSPNKLGLLIHNRRLIASLSTAAILVISLFAYSLMPQISTKKETASIANDMTQVQESVVNGSSAASIQDKSSMAAKDPSVGVNSKVATGDADITVTFSEQVPAANKNIAPSNQTNQDKPEASSSRKKVSNDINNETTNSQKYFLNYSELNLKVSPGGIEIEDLRKFMIGLGAIERKSDTINTMFTTSVQSTTANSLESQNYTEYFVPLSLYSTLMNQAIINKLQLSTKTDIIKNDITFLYNDLNTQKIGIDKKIEEAITKSEDASSFEAEKIRITEEINKIITENNMVIVRVFYIH